METTNFLVMFTFLFLQTFGSSNNNMMMTFSNVTCFERERESLLIFKRSLTDRVNRLSTWTGVECCKWRGVECDAQNGHVVKLDLRNPASFTDKAFYNGNSLGGELSDSLLNLKHLLYLDLSLNNFSGHIPEFLGSFKRLEYLNLSQSGFSGVVPRHLGNLSSLQYLDLANFNLMVKDDLRWVSSLSLLKHLDLSGINIGNHTDWFHPVNMLPSLLTLNLASCHVSIPSIKFINLTSLSSLDLSFNYINSTIPVWLSNLTSLMHLNLHGNSFHDQIPDFLGTLSSLTSINLSKNLFDTSIPNAFWNLSSLVRVDLSQNMFHGSIPRNVNLCNLSVLNLWQNKFSGELSSFIGNLSDCMLTSLKYLNLEWNNFNGSMPNKFGEFKKLEQLLLSVNALSGPIPPSLGGLSSLRHLKVNSNQLSGSIPASLGLLLRLETLDLNSNLLSGIIPASLGQLLRLEKLDLYNNQLSGNIPTSLGQLSNLKSLDVSDNSLVGVLSETHFTKLKNLTVLWLSYNSLSLNFTSRWIPPFQLHEFYADSCNVGPDFPKLLRTSTNMRYLYLSNASIRDTIPQWFENISSHINYMDLSYNQINGNLPRFDGYSSNLQGRYLIMNMNKFEGSLASFPANVKVLDLSDNLLSGLVPHTDGTMNPSLESVNLSKNRFTGSFPVHLCKILSLGVLDLSHNKFSGSLPGCLGNLNHLRVLVLTNNTITGTIPNSLGSLKDLWSLHLANNIFVGYLPESLQSLRGLVTMDLGNNLFKGSIPIWIGEKLLNLRILNMQSNKFTGKIPLQLCQLNTLQHLNLAHNKIFGTIPLCFRNLSGMIMDEEYIYNSGTGNYKEKILASTKGNQLMYTTTPLQYLTSLDLSSNNISGEIPDVLMNLVGLNNLNLSRNLLEGRIPTKIGNLKKIESLDLSLNNLCGPIPPTLSDLNFLSSLNLSFNNLSGAIPVGNQIQTLDDPSIYQGNNGLCGPPVSRSCIENGATDVVEDVKGHDDTPDLWFYIGMGSGFVVGTMGLIGSLYFARTWRVAYFNILESVYDWFMVSILVTFGRLRREFFQYPSSMEVFDDQDGQR